MNKYIEAIANHLGVTLESGFDLNTTASKSVICKRNYRLENHSTQDVEQSLTFVKERVAELESNVSLLLKFIEEADLTVDALEGNFTVDNLKQYAKLLEMRKLSEKS